MYKLSSFIFSVVREEEIWHCRIDVICLKSSFTCIWSSLFHDIEIFDKVIIELLFLIHFHFHFITIISSDACVLVMHVVDWLSIFQFSLCYAAYTKYIAFVKELYHPSQILLRGCFLRNVIPLQPHMRVCMKHLLLMRWGFEITANCPWFQITAICPYMLDTGKMWIIL